MPTIVLANFPYANGTTPNGADISQDLYDPAALTSSFDTMNGRLDDVNAAGSWPKILQRQVQRETFTSAGAAAGTANLDWFPEEWFPGVTLEGPTDSPDEIPESFYKAIPGACKTFYLPWDAFVICTWSIAYSGELWDISYPANFVIVTDGVFAHNRGQRRLLPRSMWRPTDGDTFQHYGEIKNRYWNGHFSSRLEKGWHTIGVHLICDGEASVNSNALVIAPDDADVPLRSRPVIRQIRTWVRSFKHIAFRTPL
jgi:hypothetical protein